MSNILISANQSPVFPIFHQPIRAQFWIEKTLYYYTLYNYPVSPTGGCVLCTTLTLIPVITTRSLGLQQRPNRSIYGRLSPTAQPLATIRSPRGHTASLGKLRPSKNSSSPFLPAFCPAFALLHVSQRRCSRGFSGRFRDS